MQGTDRDPRPRDGLIGRSSPRPSRLPAASPLRRPRPTDDAPPTPPATLRGRRGMDACFFRPLSLTRRRGRSFVASLGAAFLSCAGQRLGRLAGRAYAEARLVEPGLGSGAGVRRAGARGGTPIGPRATEATRSRALRASPRSSPGANRHRLGRTTVPRRGGGRCAPRDRRERAARCLRERAGEAAQRLSSSRSPQAGEMAVDEALFEAELVVEVFRRDRDGRSPGRSCRLPRRSP